MNIPGNDLEIAPLVSVPALTREEQDDASFRAQDRAWAAVVDFFQVREEQEGMTYQALATRIGRRRQQVQRWLASAFNMNTKSLGLLAEGLDADLIIELRPRIKSSPLTNYHHPSTGARAARLSLAPAESAPEQSSGAAGSGSMRTMSTRVFEDA